MKTQQCCLMHNDKDQCQKPATQVIYPPDDSRDAFAVCDEHIKNLKCDGDSVHPIEVDG